MNKPRVVSSPILKKLEAGINKQDYEKVVKKMLLASKIADALECKGISKKVFASQMGKHPSEITKWLSGKHNFTTDTLIEISSFLGIDLINTKKQPSRKWYKYPPRPDYVTPLLPVGKKADTFYYQKNEGFNIAYCS